MATGRASPSSQSRSNSPTTSDDAHSRHDLTTNEADDVEESNNIVVDEEAQDVGENATAPTYEAIRAAFFVEESPPDDYDTQEEKCELGEDHPLDSDFDDACRASQLELTPNQPATENLHPSSVHEDEASKQSNRSTVDIENKNLDDAESTLEQDIKVDVDEEKGEPVTDQPTTTPNGVVVAQPLQLESAVEKDQASKNPPKKHLFRRIAIVFVVLAILCVGIVTPIVRLRNSGSGEKRDLTRLNHTISYLMQGISLRALLLRDGTPQNLAAAWIANSDPLQYPVPASFSQAADSSEKRFVQRYVLAVFYYTLNGGQWSHDRNFLSGTDECDWHEAKGSALDAVPFGVTCSDSRTVRELNLYYHNLKGTLPGELQFLTDLEYVSLRSNAIQGSIPFSLDTLSNIEYFDVRFNEMTGSIPDWMQNWKSLQVLGLSNNMFVGQLPSSIASLTHLKTLALDYNAFNGNIFSIATLTDLEYVYMTSNQFTGQLDQVIFEGMPNLVELDLQDNIIIATEAAEFPVTLFRKTNLRILELSQNAIACSIPFFELDIARNKALKYFAMFGNRMYGTIPSTISNLVGLQQLDLSSNQFTGTIPYQMDRLSNLRYLYLGQNSFSRGPLQNLFSNFPDMKELSLNAANMIGTLPRWLGGMTHLELLDIRDNDFSGAVPTGLWELTSLTHLLLSGNYLEGQLPTETVPPNLKLLAIHENNLEGIASAFCANNIATMTFDCDKVTCTCCRLGCCREGVTGACYEDLEWVQDLGYANLIWEHNYTKARRAFSNQLLNGTV